MSVLNQFYFRQRAPNTYTYICQIAAVTIAVLRNPANAVLDILHERNAR